jgi:hypothetical protein
MPSAQSRPLMDLRSTVRAREDQLAAARRGAAPLPSWALRSGRYGVRCAGYDVTSTRRNTEMADRLSGFEECLQLQGLIVVVGIALAFVYLAVQLGLWLLRLNRRSHRASTPWRGAAAA